MNESSQSSLAVLIDYENLALGTGKRKRNGHQEPGPRPDVKRILERLVDKGRITAKRAYCDWQRFDDAITPLHELGIELIEIPDRAYTGKNSADIRLSVDAMEMCLTKDHIDTFAILSGDSDFSPLVTKLKEFGKTVIGVGMKQSTSPLLAEVCRVLPRCRVLLGGRPNALARSVFLEPGCLPLVLVTDGPLHAVYAAAGYRVGGVQLAETVLRQAKEGLR